MQRAGLGSWTEGCCVCAHFRRRFERSDRCLRLEAVGSTDGDKSPQSGGWCCSTEFSGRQGCSITSLANT